MVVDGKYYNPDVILGKYKIEVLENVFGNTNETFDVIVAFGHYSYKVLERFKPSIRTILNYEIFYGTLELGGCQLFLRFIMIAIKSILDMYMIVYVMRCQRNLLYQSKNKR